MTGANSTGSPSTGSPSTGSKATESLRRLPFASKPLWIFAIVFMVCTALGIAAFISWRSSAYIAYWTYEPREGDVIFQSLPHSRLVRAIEGASQSPFSHCGIVARRDGGWAVYEAYDGVEVTPLKEFIFRGRDVGFAVYRLRSEYQSNIPATIAHAATYLGRPYDVRYRMDDEKIYCSELIYKAYGNATSGEKLGELVRLGDLNWQPYEATIEYFEEGPVPLQREMITPRDLARAKQFELVKFYRIEVE